MLWWKRFRIAAQTGVESQSARVLYSPWQTVARACMQAYNVRAEAPKIIATYGQILVIIPRTLERWANNSSSPACGPYGSPTFLACALIGPAIINEAQPQRTLLFAYLAYSYDLIEPTCRVWPRGWYSFRLGRRYIRRYLPLQRRCIPLVPERASKRAIHLHSHARARGLSFAIGNSRVIFSYLICISYI